VQDRLLGRVEEVYGDKALSIVASLLEGFLCPGAGRCVTVISSVTVPYGAIRVFVQLQDALNAIWEVESKVRPTIFRRLRRRFRAFVTTLMAGTLILVVAIVLPSVEAVTPFLSDLPGVAIIWQAADFLVTWLLVALAFALICMVLPNVTLAWHDV
tara:strand:- start:875 stop:1342 length:468 start_codon:yes stop_codon:yes gene_type:complete